LESRFDSGTTPSFLVFDVTGPLAYTIPITDHPMATTTVWNIGQLERHTADGIVFTAHYTVDANDGTYSAGAYGSIGLEAPEDNIIPFASLTPEIVIGWVQDKLNVEEIEAALQAQIDQQRTPTTAAGVPWS
jgi:hypothetical protein